MHACMPIRSAATPRRARREARLLSYDGCCEAAETPCWHRGRTGRKADMWFSQRAWRRPPRSACWSTPGKPSEECSPRSGAGAPPISPPPLPARRNRQRGDQAPLLPRPWGRTKTNRTQINKLACLKFRSSCHGANRLQRCSAAIYTPGEAARLQLCQCCLVQQASPLQGFSICVQRHIALRDKGVGLH